MSATFAGSGPKLAKVNQTYTIFRSILVIMCHFRMFWANEMLKSRIMHQNRAENCVSVIRHAQFAHVPGEAMVIIRAADSGRKSSYIHPHQAESFTFQLLVLSCSSLIESNGDNDASARRSEHAVLRVRLPSIAGILSQAGRTGRGFFDSDMYVPIVFRLALSPLDTQDW